MNNYIEKIKAAIDPLRNQIINHKVYSVIKDIEDINVFMKYHVFAVWDFMSLLKSLQNNLTCTSVPWFPKGSADTRFLINEIVVGEESDIDLNGLRKSHFELYLDAMNQSKADTTYINNFIELIKKNTPFDVAFNHANVPVAAQQFVRNTFNIIQSNQPHIQAATFTFGREDLIPGMFHAIINDIEKVEPDKITVFKYYLERHIEVDGDHHSHLALEMTALLCEQDEKKWSDAIEASITSLQSRIYLWDGVYNEIINREK